MEAQTKCVKRSKYFFCVLGLAVRASGCPAGQAKEAVSVALLSEPCRGASSGNLSRNGMFWSTRGVTWTNQPHDSLRHRDTTSYNVRRKGLCKRVKREWDRVLIRGDLVERRHQVVHEKNRAVFARRLDQGEQPRAFTPSKLYAVFGGLILSLHAYYMSPCQAATKWGVFFFFVP